MPLMTEPDQEYLQRAQRRAKLEKVRIRRDGMDTYTTSSKSDPKQTYWLTVDVDGKVDCSCLGFGYRGGCKHSEALKLRLQREQKRVDQGWK